jgi:hypothetical protein
MARPKQKQGFPCPHCGALVPVGAVACRECGSDADTGWQSDEEVDYQSLDLPQGWSTDPDHPSRLQGRPRSSNLVVVVSLVLVVLLAYWAITRG